MLQEMHQGAQLWPSGLVYLRHRMPERGLLSSLRSGTIKGLRVDLFEMRTYAEIDLSANPCISLPCGHIFTVEILDGEVAMPDHYIRLNRCRRDFSLFTFVSIIAMQ